MRLLDEQYLRDSILWLAAYDRLFAATRVCGERQTVQATHAEDGLTGHLSQAQDEQAGRKGEIYPYLLRGLEITQPNFVWSADITYMPMRQGFMYLVAIIDWFSRYVLTWQLSNTLDGYFCLDALQQALQQGQPAIFNTDQGSQFTADEFTACLERADIRISMDGRGRALDKSSSNVFGVASNMRTSTSKTMPLCPNWLLAWLITFTSTIMRGHIRASTIARLPSYTLLEQPCCCCFSFHLIFVAFWS